VVLEDVLSKGQWNELEHKLWRQLDGMQDLLKGQRLLLAVSGGLDSMVLLQLMQKMASPLNFVIAVANVHHGESENTDFRNQSSLFIADTCAKLGLEYFRLGPSPEVLKSESQLRDYRYSELRSCMNKNKFDFIVLAHHSDDLLETRLLRLLRGVGIEGLLAMQTYDRPLLRPLLNFSRSELLNYAQSEGLAHLEDPTNSENDKLRNWVRNSWLMSLEEHLPGSKLSLARSLENIASELTPSEPLNFLEEGIGWTSYLSWDDAQRRKYISRYLLSLGVKDFRRGQVDEIIKRLDKNQVVHTFELAHCHWQIDAKRIKATRS
jgi:tRNA(Ile)-lysidine synthase